MSTESKTTAAEAKPAKGTSYRFKNGAKLMTHSYLGALTNEHLNAPDGYVLAAIKKLDARGPKEGGTTKYFETNIEAA